MKTRIINQRELSYLVHTVWMRERGISLIPLVIVMGGDRIHCCDEAVVVEDESGALVGAATIAPNGEDFSGQPGIVGVYVIPECRNRGLSKVLMTAVTERCVERGFKEVRVDVMSGRILRVINALSAELRGIMKVVDHTTANMDAMADLESAQRLLQLIEASDSSSAGDKE